MSDELDALSAMEIDIEVADVGEILQRYGVSPTAEMVFELWHWMEMLRRRSSRSDDQIGRP